MLRLVKSETIWESNESTFEILMESSKKLFDQEIAKWEKKKTNLENQKNSFMKRLEENSSIETFRTENEAFERHKLNVVNEENKIKVGKILRDTDLKRH